MVAVKLEHVEQHPFHATGMRPQHTGSHVTQNDYIPIPNDKTTSFSRTSSWNSLFSHQSTNVLGVPSYPSAPSAQSNSLNPYKVLPPVTPQQNDDHFPPPGSAMSTFSNLSGFLAGYSPGGSEFMGSPRNSGKSRGLTSQARKRTLSVSPFSIDGIEITTLIRNSPTSLFLASRGSSQCVSPMNGELLSSGIYNNNLGGTYGHLSARKSVSPSAASTFSHRLLVATPSSPNNAQKPDYIVGRHFLNVHDMPNRSTNPLVASTDDYLTNAYVNGPQFPGENGQKQHFNRHYEPPETHHRQTATSSPSMLVVASHNDNIALENSFYNDAYTGEGNYHSNIVKCEVDAPGYNDFPSHSNSVPPTFLPRHHRSQRDSNTYAVSYNPVQYPPTNPPPMPYPPSKMEQSIQMPTTLSQTLPSHMTQINIPPHSGANTGYHDDKEAQQVSVQPTEGGMWICRWIECNQLFKVNFYLSIGDSYDFEPPLYIY